MGLGSLLNIGKQSLLVNQAALQTIGHNIANAGVDGYSRQEVIPQNNPALETNYGFLGTGVRVDTVRQLSDRFLNTQITKFKSELGALRSQSEGAVLAEAFLNEAGTEAGINASINKFFLSAEDLATAPEGVAERNGLVNSAEILIEKFNSLGVAIEDMMITADNDILRAIAEVNQLVTKMGELNTRITVSETNGNTANDLRDERQRTLENLSELTDTSFIEEKDGALLVFVGRSVPFVSKGVSNKLVGVNNPDNVVGNSPPVALKLVKFEDKAGNQTDLTTRITGGEIGGLIKFRDTTLKELLDNVNNIAATLVNEVNIIHRSGFGLDGSTDLDFFQPLKISVSASSSNSKDATTSNKNVQAILSDSRIIDPTTLTMADYKIDFTSATTFTLTDVDTNQKLDATKVSINGAPLGTDSSITEFAMSGSTVTAEFEGLRVAVQKFGGNPEKGDSFDISIRKGAAKALALNQLIAADTNKVAAADAPNIPGDNGNALALANLRGKTVASRDSASIGGFMNVIISNFGTLSADLASRYELSEQVTDSLKATREEVAGVSIDEEMANILLFQQNFNASSHLMSIVSELMKSILDIL